MNVRTAATILLVTCPFFTLADTKVILPHSQRFADPGTDFLLETTIPGDFKIAVSLGAYRCHAPGHNGAIIYRSDGGGSRGR